MRSRLGIDLGTIVANARTLASLSAPASFCAVVKSNAYGHGLVPVSEALETAGIPGLSLAVFEGEEALTVRSAISRSTSPMLVVGPVADDELASLVHAGIEVAALGADDARRLGSAHAQVHLKVDTGVSRFGTTPEEAATVARALTDDGASVVGIYSHLASAEELDAARARRQLEALDAAAKAVGTAIGSRPKRHIAASAAAMLWPQMRLDMVRCGIALYGHWPSAEVRAALRDTVTLTPALRWFAPVAQVRTIAAGDSVGYGGEWTATRPSTIATLALGYADGLPRAAGGGRLCVRIGTSSAPIVGRICMNACMADVTDVHPTPARGDDVEIDVADVAQAAGTIEYEVLARLPASLERRYSR